MSKSGQSHARILKVYIETLAGSSHIFTPDGLSNSLLSQGCILENGSSCEYGGWTLHSKHMEGGERLHHLGPACGLTGGHILLKTSSNEVILRIK